VSAGAGRERAERLLALAAGAVERATGGLDEPMRVSWYDALDADRCPAEYRGRLAELGGDWEGWSPVIAARSVARAALLTYLESPPPPGGVHRRPDPLTIVRDQIAMARTNPVRSVDEWLADATTTDHERRATAARATRWLTALLRMIGWPLPPRTSLDDGPRWRAGSVTVVASLDATSGRVTAAGEHEGLVLVTSSGRGVAALRDRACVEAAAMTLGRGIAPAAVVVLTADAGDRICVAASDDALARGLDLIVAAVRERVTARSVGYDEADTRPGQHCRTCARADRCPPGQAWLAGPGRRRKGLPVLP
jgi:hypothetical protein